MEFHATSGRAVMRYIAILFLLISCTAQAQDDMLLLLMGGGSITYPTWSATNKSSNIVLSNGNLTYRGTAGQTGIGIATVGKSSGKWYWEVTIDSASASSLEIAGVTTVVPTSGNISRLGVVSTSIAYRGNASSYCYLKNVTGSFTTQGSGCNTDFTAGTVLSCALDMDNLTFTMYIDGTQINVAVTGLGAGTWYPACQSDGSAGRGTANFGQNSWSGTTSTIRGTLAGAGYTIGIY